MIIQLLMAAFAIGLVWMMLSSYFTIDRERRESELPQEIQDALYRGRAGPMSADRASGYDTIVKAYWSDSSGRLGPWIERYEQTYGVPPHADEKWRRRKPL